MPTQYKPTANSQTSLLISLIMRRLYARQRLFILVIKHANLHVYLEILFPFENGFTVQQDLVWRMCKYCISNQTLSPWWN